MASPRPISNKTRIETAGSHEKKGRQSISQTDFQQNKDWNKNEMFTIFCQNALPDRFPTKQGLKPGIRIPRPALPVTPRPISNKTRIETRRKPHLRAMSVRSQTDFQQNKDWNFFQRRWMGLLVFSQTDFQQNKDWNPAQAAMPPKNASLPDRFPTKQGLKQSYILGLQCFKLSPRPISNKTRIETQRHACC